ncbi:T9SS type A sorting domain-containing protein, partial [bacterium]|nr:T9SS type A sorting domain-containing protein [bacterium]
TYPNPFNSSTSIRYSLDRDGLVTLKLYDLSGREVITLMAGNQSQGQHIQQISSDMLTSGIYLLKLTAGNRSSVMKVALVK